MTDQTPAGQTPVGMPGSARPAGPSRRGLLAAAAAALPLLLSACKGVQALGSPPPLSHDVRVLQSAIVAEELMVARYTAALAQLPATGAAATVAALRTVAEQHSAHLTQLRSRLIEPSGSTPSPHPRHSLTPSATPHGSLATMLAMLEHAERAASDRLIGQLAGLPPTLAQLFASIAASEATHVPFLQRLGSAA